MARACPLCRFAEWRGAFLCARCDNKLRSGYLFVCNQSTGRKKDKIAMSTKKKIVQTTANAEQTQELTPIVEAGFWERFSWRDFFCYGLIWFVIFFAGYCVFQIGNVISEQRRQIDELIDRLNQYEDYTPSPPFDRDEDEATDDLTAWVKKNLPAKGIEERPAVAEVFGNLADMLEAGTLTGEKDTFSEGIAQLQPVATRSVWLPFLTKLTKRLKAAKLDSAGLADACRKVSRAIYTPARKISEKSFATEAPLLLLEGAKTGLKDDTAIKPSQSDSQSESGEPDKLSPVTANPSLIAPDAPKNEDKPESNDKTTEKSCPTGNCPVQNQNQNGYQYPYYGGYTWRYF